MNRQPPPPKPIARPDRVQVFKALYNYTAQQPDELSFNEGDLLYVTDTSDAKGGWWTGRCGDKHGLIPSNYVAECTESINFPLHEAAKRGDLLFMKECLNNNVSANGLDKSGSTPLYWAAHGGHIECLKMLLSQKPDINCGNKLGDTALHAAAWKGRAAAVQLLLENGANPWVKNNENKTPLDLASDPETAAALKRACETTADNSLGDYAESDSENSD